MAPAPSAEEWTRPWRGLVHEREVAPGVFECESGPFRTYRRTVTVDGPTVRSQVSFRLAVPYFGWLLHLPVRHALRRPGAPLPWWGPADRLDARAASVLGALCAAAMVGGFLGTSITQTITYVAEDFGHRGDGPQSVALAAVRLAIVPAIALVWLADRAGRRRVLLAAAASGVALAAVCAAMPSLAWFTAAQTLLRGFSTALALLVTVVAAEEMPAGARAFAAAVLSMSAALGAGICVVALPLAEVGEGGWRLVHLVPLLAVPIVVGLRRRVPESRRYVDHALEAPTSTVAHGAQRDRLALLAASTFLIQLFIAPASQLQNEFLRDERGYSAGAISLFTLLTNTPAGLAVLAAGRLADRHGRRVVGAVGLAGGVAGTVAMYHSAGAAMWTWSLVGGFLAGATVPSLGVYGPELFPTGVRARANGVLAATGVLGSAGGLLLAGRLSDSLGSLGGALALLAVGPAILVVLVLTRYPETARLELEDINPEDRRPSAPPSTR